MTSRAAALASFVVLAATIWLVGFRSQAPAEGSDAPTPTAAVRRATLEVSVQCVGELEPERSTVIASAIRGERGKIVRLVADGAEVHEGDVLVELDPSPFEEDARDAALALGQAESLVAARRELLAFERSQAERAVRAAEFDLKEAELALQREERGDGPLTLATLEGDLADAAVEWEKTRGFLDDLVELQAKGFIDASEVDEVRRKAAKFERQHALAARKLESTRDFIQPAERATLAAAIERARMELEQTRVSTGHKIGEALAALTQAEHDVEARRAELADARAELERCSLRAPIPGMVVLREEFRDGQRRKPRVGDAVWQGQAILDVPDLGRMQVATRVREIELYKVAQGARATVAVDAYPDQRFEAEVRSLGVLAEHRAELTAGEKFFRVTLSVDTSDSRLRPGMTARVEIRSARVEHALCAPIEAVWEEHGVHFAFVANGERFRRRELQLGQDDGTWVEIRSGLEEGERVALARPVDARIEAVPQRAR